METKKVNVKYFLFSSVQHASMLACSLLLPERRKKKGLISHMPLIVDRLTILSRTNLCYCLCQGTEEKNKRSY